MKTDAERLQGLEAELRRTNDIIKYLEYLLMGKRSWKRETEFRINKIQSLESTVRDEE